MIDITEPVAPQSHRGEASQTKKSRLALVSVVVLSVLLLGVCAYAAYEHHGLGQSQAHAASVSSQLADTQKHLKMARSSLAASEGNVASLNTQLSTCRVVVNVSKHMDQVGRDELDAMQADVFMKPLYLQEALDEMKSLNRILTNHGYNSVRDLYSACIGSGGLST